MIDVDLEGELPPTLRELLTALDREVSQNPRTNDVHEVLAYGWLDDDTADPADIGIIADEPAAGDEKLTETGEEFIGAMEFARRSIGMAFCQAASADPASLDAIDVFWYQYTTSIQWLSIASDRMRPFFEAGLLNKAGKKRRKRGEKYCAPFREMAPVSKHEEGLKSYLMPI